MKISKVIIVINQGKHHAKKTARTLKEILDRAKVRQQWLDVISRRKKDLRIPAPHPGPRRRPHHRLRRRRHVVANRAPLSRFGHSHFGYQHRLHGFHHFGGRWPRQAGDAPDFGRRIHRERTHGAGPRHPQGRVEANPRLGVERRRHHPRRKSAPHQAAGQGRQAAIDAIPLRRLDRGNADRFDRVFAGGGRPRSSVPSAMSWSSPPFARRAWPTVQSS